MRETSQAQKHKEIKRGRSKKRVMEGEMRQKKGNENVWEREMNLKGEKIRKRK